MTRKKLPTTKYGLLRVAEEAGEDRYLCTCQCGGTRVVLKTSLRSGSVTACEECTAAGLAATRPRPKRRVMVTLDPDVLSRLGLPPGTTGEQLRSFLRSLAERG